jgi:hypothetical protein
MEEGDSHGENYSDSTTASTGERQCKVIFGKAIVVTGKITSSARTCYPWDMLHGKGLSLKSEFL